MRFEDDEYGNPDYSAPLYEEYGEPPRLFEWVICIIIGGAGLILSMLGDG